MVAYKDQYSRGGVFTPPPVLYANWRSNTRPICLRTISRIDQLFIKGKAPHKFQVLTSCLEVLAWPLNTLTLPSSLVLPTALTASSPNNAIFLHSILYHFFSQKIQGLMKCCMKWTPNIWIVTWWCFVSSLQGFWMGIQTVPVRVKHSLFLKACSCILDEQLGTYGLFSLKKVSKNWSHPDYIPKVHNNLTLVLTLQ